MSSRIAILDAVMEAHLGGNYVLSIPALLAQTEGIMAEVNGHTGRMNTGNYKEYIQKATARDPELSDLIERFVTEHLLTQFNHGDTIPELSGHAILHGADVMYGTGKFFKGDSVV